MVLAQVMGGVISIFLSAFFLWIVSKLFRLKDKSFGMALKIAAFVGIIGMALNFFLKGALSIVIFIITLMLAVALVRKFHEVSWGKSCLVAFVWVIISATAAILVAFVLGMFFLGLGVTGMASLMG